MTHSNDDGFTRNLNDRIRELENMTNEINDQTQELEDQASKNEQAENDTAESETMEFNQAEDHRAEGDTLFFTANVDSTKPLKLNVTNNNGDLEVVGFALGDVCGFFSGHSRQRHLSMPSHPRRGHRPDLLRQQSGRAGNGGEVGEQTSHEL